jgi:hypothetical protein
MDVVLADVLEEVLPGSIRFHPHNSTVSPRQFKL